VRFVKAHTEQGPRLGVVRPDGVAELARTESRLEPYFGDDGEALRRLADAIHANPAGESSLDALTLLKPVDPVSMRDFMVFEEHVLPSWRKSGMSRGPDVWYEQPIGYFSNAATIRGPRDPIEIPGGSERLDFELEVGAVIGREAVSVPPDGAADRIAGFCILCDWSARDLQFREMDGRLGPFKGKDFGSSLGPIFVTPDELASRRSGNGYDLLMTSSVNGRQYGSDRWSSAYWSFEDLISYASWNSRVEAGSIIGSGTCQGGCILELSNRHSPEEYPWLAPGDQVTLSIELMGDIRATVQAPARGPWPGRKQIAPDGAQALAMPPGAGGTHGSRGARPRGR
jgi:2-keto-4-pentenoate hydratase/2-oxohepta-3-ene-1,7-dioic acid hydratase in catechol pathway